MEIKPSDALEVRSSWNLGKLGRAEKMLKKGFAPVQVGRELRLNVAEVEALAVEAEVEAVPMVETFADWRTRKKEEMTWLLATIASDHLTAVHDSGKKLLDRKTMATVKDASAIAYLWLCKGEETAKHRMAVDFTVLANAKRPRLWDSGT